MDDRPRVALVGCGWFACEAHIPALLRLERSGLIELAALCSRSEASLARARKRIGRPTLKTYTDLHQLLADPQIDLVDLVLPIATMPSAIRASLRAGKHVISEKPCAPTVREGLDLIEEHAALANPPLWAVAENWRFKPSTLLIERIVASGAIGAVHFADFRHMTFAGPTDLGWRGSPDYPGGFLLDSGVHFVALLRKLMGPVERVCATVSQRLSHLPPADSVTALLSFAGGAEGSFRLSFAARHADGQPGLSLVGSEGSIVADFLQSTVEVRDRSGRRVTRVKNDLWVPGGVHDLLAHCVTTLRQGTPLRSTAWDALCDVAVLEAMLTSSRTRQPVLPQTLTPALSVGGRPLNSYGRVWSFNPRHVVDCASIEAVRAAVASAVAAGLRVRVMGNGLSWAQHVVTRDVCLRLSGLNRVKAVDVARKTVVVEAGVRLGDLSRTLATHGLALPSLSFLSDATIGGAVATGTHGTSPKWGTLSDAVTAMTLVLASGEVTTISAETSPDEMRAARVAVGTLGVITELELQLVDMPWARFSQAPMSLTSFLAQKDLLFRRYDHLWVHWTLDKDDVLVKGLEVRTASAKGFHRYVTGDNAFWENPRQFRQGVGWVKGVVRRARDRVAPRSASGPENEAERGLVWMSMQYGVPAASFETALNRLRTSGVPHAHAGQVVELKFLKGMARSYLGPNADGDAVLFNIWWLVDESVKYTVFDQFECVMRGLHARPHWGKFHRPPDVDYMRAAYPQWAAFDRVRARLDPHGVFSIFPRDEAAENHDRVLGAAHA